MGVVAAWETIPSSSTDRRIENRGENRAVSGRVRSLRRVNSVDIDVNAAVRRAELCLYGTDRATSFRFKLIAELPGSSRDTKKEASVVGLGRRST